MKWESRSKNFILEIKLDKSAGYYLYVFKNGKCILDYLQDSFEIATDIALEEYGVPKEAWIQVT